MTYFTNHRGANGKAPSIPASPTHPSNGAPAKTVVRHINLNDARALDSKYGVDADDRCASGADDYLRRAAKYEFNWEHIGFLGAKFDRYLTVVPSPGILIVLTNKISLQSGSETYKRITLYCEYDTQAKKVLRYWMFQ